MIFGSVHSAVSGTDSAHAQVQRDEVHAHAHHLNTGRSARRRCSDRSTTAPMVISELQDCQPERVGHAAEPPLPRVSDAFPEYTFLRHAPAMGGTWGRQPSCCGRAPLVPRMGRRTSRPQPPAPGRGGPPPQPVSIPKAVFADADPVRSCESLRSVVLPDTTIDAAVVDPGDERTLPSCRVTATVTHPPAGDRIKVFVGLPLKGWNGRFQGVGGGGFSGGSANGVRTPLAAGYAAGATDTGHEGGSGSFALDANGRLNWHAIRDNAYLGIHEMTVTGKALTREFYGKAPRYTYFNGCSTGGRQGLSEAQRYPDDYDGILSGAPAINWPKLHVEQLWGQLVMLEAKNFVPQCKFEAATAAAIAGVRHDRRRSRTACSRIRAAASSIRRRSSGRCRTDVERSRTRTPR